MLTPAIIDRTIDRALALLGERRRAEVDTPKRIDAELRKERRQRDNLIDAIAQGEAPASVIEKIRELDARIAMREQELRTLKIEEPSELELRQVKRAFRRQLTQFDALLHSDVPLARQALRKLLAGRIMFAPEVHEGAKRYHLRWALVTQPLVGEGYIEVASPGGVRAIYIGPDHPRGGMVTSSLDYAPDHPSRASAYNPKRQRQSRGFSA